MRATPVVLALGLLLAAPGSASADVIFDPADADDLAAVLAEAYTDQDVCYGWRVTVNDVASISESVGSNFGAGNPVTSGSCQASVEFTATITYTSESSESEDSAYYDVSSTPPSVTQSDLDALGLDFDGLTGEDPDVVIGKAVTALPLLAADKGIATPLSAAPETATAPADAQLTDDPGSDWWRGRGGMVIWALILMAASGVLVWAVLKTNRRRRPTHEMVVHAPPVPDFPPPDLTWTGPLQQQTEAEPQTERRTEPRAEPQTDSQTEPQAESQTEPQSESQTEPQAESRTERRTESQTEPQVETRTEPQTEPFPLAEEPKATAPEEPATPPPVESAVDEEPGAPEQARPAPSDQKDKE